VATVDKLGPGHWRVRISMPGAKRRACCIWGTRAEAEALGRALEDERDRESLRPSSRAVQDLRSITGRLQKLTEHLRALDRSETDMIALLLEHEVGHLARFSRPRRAR
jgi:hypothetical protein